MSGRRKPAPVEPVSAAVHVWQDGQHVAEQNGVFLLDGRGGPAVVRLASPDVVTSWVFMQDPKIACVVEATDPFERLVRSEAGDVKFCSDVVSIAGQVDSRIVVLRRVMPEPQPEPVSVCAPLLDAVALALEEERAKVEGLTKLAAEKNAQAAAAVSNVLEAQRRVRQLEIELEDRGIQLEIARDVAKGARARVEEIEAALARMQAPGHVHRESLRRRVLLWVRDRLSDAIRESR